MEPQCCMVLGVVPQMGPRAALHLERGSAFVICQFYQMSSKTSLRVLMILFLSGRDSKWGDLVSVDF